MKIRTFALMFGLTVQGAAHAEPAEWTRALAATCTGCHGTAGASTGPIPSIQGLEAGRMVTLLQEFRDGRRDATIMHQLAKGYTDAQIQALAQWFASQTR